jgi:Domain of unknown function (DUF4397)
MRLGRRLVLLTATTTLLGGAVAAIVIASPAAYAAAAGAPAPTRAQALSVAAEQGNTGWVRYANLSQGTAEDVYLYSFGNPQNQTVLMHQGYGGVSSYMQLSAGEYTVAVRAVGAAAASPASITTSFMVSAGTNYTVASLGSATGRRLKVLQDQIAAPSGEALVRVIQASSKQPRVTVSIGADTVARQLALGSVTTYRTVPPGDPTVEFSSTDGHAAKPVTLAAGSVHTIVVLDGTSGLKIDNLTDAAASQVPAKGGAATGLGGTAPGPGAPSLAPWLATLAAGLLLAVAGGFGLRRSRRTNAVAGH